jgi:hypothetical protein
MIRRAETQEYRKSSNQTKNSFKVNLSKMMMVMNLMYA